MSRSNLLYWCLILFLIGKIPAFSQSSSFVFKNITIDDGLSQNSVVDIAQDSLGFMWFATHEGLNRFDGKDFKTFSRSFDHITNPDNSRLGKLFIYENELWMITKGGKLEVLDMETEKFRTLQHFNKGAGKIPLVRCLYIQSKDKIFIGTENDGLYLVNSRMEIQKHYHANSKGPEKILSNYINQIKVDSRKNIWVLTNNGINKISKNSNTAHLEGIHTNALVEDPYNNYWLGTVGNGLYLYSKQNKFIPYSSASSSFIPSDLTIKTIHIEENRHLWIGTYGNGLYVINLKHSDLNQYLPDRENPFSIGFQDILSIYQDKNGGIWIGTDGGGLSFFDQTYQNFKLFAAHNVPKGISVEQIRSIVRDKNGLLWWGTSGNGFTSYDPNSGFFKSFLLEPFRKGIANDNRIISLHADDYGDLWIGTHGNGTIIFDPSTGNNKKWFNTDAPFLNEQTPDNTIWCFVKEGEKRVFAGSQSSGILLMDKDTGLVKRYQDNYEELENVRSLERINDSILAVGYYTSGIKLLNTRTGVFTPLAENFIKDDLEQVEIKSLYYSNDWLWAGTAGKGLLVINLITEKIKNFTQDQGLPNEMIYGILPEDTRTIWASTNKGLFRLTYKKEDGDLSIENLNLFGRENGLQSNEFNTGAFYRSEDNTLYFGGIKGVNYFQPQNFGKSRNKTKVVISQATVNNVPVEREKSVIYSDQLSLPYKDNSIAFNYTALDFVMPEKQNYLYQLEGYDSDWIEAGSRKYTAYTNLLPGNYTFKVKISESFLEEAPVTALGISIASPYWQTWWFVFIIFIFLLSFLYAIYRNRINQLLELQKVKDTISADLHDDLGSRLTTVHLLSAISKSKFQNDSEMNDILQKIDKEIYASSEALDEIVWNIRMADESLSDIIAKIRRYVGESLESQNIIYTVETSDKFELVKMSMQKRRELFLICKELINNIRKHAQAGKVEFIICRDGNYLYISVKDNGVGFNAEEIHYRNGVSNIRKRVKKWNGNIKVHSEINKGTRVEIWIPFDRKSLFRYSLNKLFKKITLKGDCNPGSY